MTASNDPAVLGRNLAALAARGVLLSEAPAGLEVRLEAGPADAVLSLCAADGRWVRLHSQRDPVAEADRLIAPSFEASEPALIIVIGLGLGYVLDAVEQRSSRTKVLALEPVPASLRHMFVRRDWSAWLTEGRLRLLVGPDYSGASDAWKDFDADASTPPIVIHPVLGHRAGDAVARAREVVERIAFGARSNLDARMRFAARYLLNTLKNLPVIAREGNTEVLFTAFKGVPAIVASAGPSLNHNIPEILRFPDRALLIAVDTALRPLLGAGLDPHLVVAVDPSEANAGHLVNLPDPGRTWLVAEGSVDPVVFEQFEGRTFIFNVSHHHPWPWLRGLGFEPGALRAWGSVATSAFDLALTMGCDPIIFAGQDLAYTHGRPYCRGTTWEAAWEAAVAAGHELPDVWAATLEQAQTVEDVHGDSVATRPQLVAFRDWIAEQTARLDGRTVINATGGGILYGPGIRQADLGAVLASLPTRRDMGAQLQESWERTRSASGRTKATGPELLEAFTRAARGQELITWAAFANMTPGALSEELTAVAATLSGQLIDHVRARQPIVSSPPSPRVDRDDHGVVYPPEIARAFLAAVVGEPVPEWAQRAAGAVELIDTDAFRQAIGRLPPATLRVAAERCEAAGAFAHAVTLYSRLADRSKQNRDPETARSATINCLRCLICAGRFEAAEDLVDREALLPDEIAVVSLCGAYQMMRDHEQAVAKIAVLIASYPDVRGTRLNLALSLALTGNLQAALEQIDIDASRWPGRVVSRYVRGLCLRLHGDHEGAIETLAVVVDEWPYAAPELLVAGMATGRPEPIEHALLAMRDAFPSPMAFVMVADDQTALVDEALTLLGNELAKVQRYVNVRWLSPSALLFVLQTEHVLAPRWRPF